MKQLNVICLILFASCGCSNTDLSRVQTPEANSEQNGENENSRVNVADTPEKLGQLLFEALVASDKEAFLKLHVDEATVLAILGEFRKQEEEDFAKENSQSREALMQFFNDQKDGIAIKASGKIETVGCWKEATFLSASTKKITPVTSGGKPIVTHFHSLEVRFRVKGGEYLLIFFSGIKSRDGNWFLQGCHSSISKPRILALQ